MTEVLSPRMRRPSRTAAKRSRLATAIAGGLLALAATPAFAVDTTSNRGAQIAGAVASVFETGAAGAHRAPDFSAQPLADGFSRRWQRRDPSPASAATVGVTATPNADTPGDPTDPDAWINEEFQADWGLEVINAHHAYARGLSGTGVRLGLLDSGAGFDHPEFAGKDHRSITMAELLADGSRCSDATVLAGPDACFYSEGDQVAVDGEYWDPELAPLFPHPDNDHLWGNTFYSFNSHGTHVAGTIAANRDGSGMHGVAFGADLSSARLFNDSLTVVDIPCIFLGQCTTLGTGADSTAFAQMYEQAIDHGVQAMNHSWGYTYTAYTPEEVALYHDALMSVPDIAATFGHMAEASRQSGMIQVVAAGNSGVNPSPEASPHASAPASLPMIFPDIEQYWVSVVNLDQDLALSERSMKCGVTAEWCIAAPGTGITSTVYDGDDAIAGDWFIDEAGNLRYGFDSREGLPGFADYSGTSMAAPHVTGALGLLFERFPYLTGAQVRDVMLTTATDLGEEGVDEIYGWGLLNLEKAIEGPGLLRVDTEVVMDTAAGGLKVWEGDAWDDWTNDIGGPGHLTKAGAGWLRLSGDNSFGGATVTGGLLEFDGANTLAGDVHVDGGTLLVGGSLDGSDLTVSDGLAIVNGTVGGGTTHIGVDGALGGSGTLGDTRVAGTIAPGNSIGTLTVDGDYTQTADATFIAELLPPDQADLLYVTGTANLLGGTLLASSLPGTYLLGQQYRILSADGGVDGEFDTLDASGVSPFLSLSLLYGADAIDIGVTRGAALASAAQSFNQLSTAAALDALPDDQGLLVPLTQLTEAQARGAFDQLSGEIHASAQQVLLDSGRLVRDAALARASSGHDGFRGQRDADANTGAWVEVQRQGGRITGDGNAARTQYSGTAALVGIDHQLDGGWRFGAFGGVGSTDFDVRQRGSKGDADTRHIGVYGSQAWGGLGVRAGYTYAWHELDIERDIAFAGYSEGVHSRYDAKAWQAFAEVGYRFGNDVWELEPYLQYAHVELDHDAFVEDGDAAALQGRSGDTRVDLGTAGLRFNVNLRGSAQEQSWLSLRGNVGYRYAGGDQVRAAALSFDGSNWYSARSPAITDEATLVELGIAARTSANSLLELGYSGVLSDEARDHGANARFSVQF
ncbi:S8 family serine peptidase [Luteimonas sp. BDR2-5]|uniref:autotransporter domain-containing protein n=1 Tax=Proluteimonas luteida TaxID=2878685 RepID=UPI001E2F3BC1|nr:autotransporter serine protease [Luteimonas sp. BDR2-5]MCD9026935.1 S8 family serine peptidase [Luteimonas sp. BDR2-5]